MFSRRVALVGAVVAIASPALAQSQFEVGQVWSLRPPAHPNSRVRIGRIEGDTIHISLWGVPAPVPQVTDVIGSPLVAGHLPITASALTRSVNQRTNDEAPRDLGFEEGYAHWRDANGGVFTLTVPEIVELILETVRRGDSSSP